MSSASHRLFVSFSLVLAVVTVPAAAQSFPLGLLPPSAPSSDPVRIGVWTDASSYAFGENVVIHLRLSGPAHVYLFDLQPDGRVLLLYPNPYSPNSFLPRGEHILPGAGYRLVASPPAGIEELLAFATNVPVPLPVGTINDPFPLVGNDPGDAIAQLVSAFRSAHGSLAWSLAWTAVQITEPHYETPPQPPPIPPLPDHEPPYPVRPGGSWHSAGAQWVAGIPVFGWYWYGGLDGRWHLCLATGT
ncbi:MAG: DUF4384 domain-containing protein [Candidatus Bipolaricaulota bacterium]|nr:MAG: DUF4384 domain-containing protein [Candidatus Bipolaricaulota bacterium]